MDFRQLENFVEVCEQMSFTKAANNLYISQQGVSKSIKSLEDELGVQLFFRTNSSLSLTNYGTILLTYANKLVKSYSEVLTTINTEKNRSKDIIKIGFANGIANFFPDGLVEDYLKAYPTTKISIKEYSDTDVDEALINGEIDIGFCVSPVDAKKLKIHHAHNMNLYFMLSDKHPLANEASIDLRQLKNDCFIAMGDGGKGHSSFLERCRKAGFFPNINVAITDTKLLMNLCRQNVGIGVYAGEKPVELPGLRIIPDKLHVWKYSMCICTAINHGVSVQEASFIKYFSKW
jgi:DNA-binding transcriptional LysR family regulator